MDNVIKVDFGKNTVSDINNEIRNLIGISPELTTYLNSLREQGVEEDDILETIDAINYVDAYLAADDEVKTFADGWLHQFL